MVFPQIISNFFKKINIFSKPTASVILNDDNYRIAYDSDKNGHLIPINKFKPDMTSDQIKAFPMMNEPMVAFADTGVFVHPYGVPPAVSYDVLWTYFKYTPEIIAVVRAIVEDIMSDGWILEGGRNNRIKAEEFLMKNYAKEQIASMLFDVMVTGDGYLYTQKLSKLEVKGRIDSILDRPEIKSLIKDETKEEMGTRIFKELEEDEDLFSVRSFVQLPSSTLKAQFNRNGDVYQWIQKVGVRFQTFTPDEILHFRLMRLDGKFYGFSPMASILKEMDILANVKDYARYFFEKGGVPNFMFILKNETPNSENFKQFKKSLQLFASLANKYKSLVVTGEVEAKELNRMTKDMEFRELAVYLSHVLIMTWGVPSSRLTDVGLGLRINTRGSTISVEGYYRKISYLQDLIEDLINMHILAQFKVHMHFKKTYLQDEIREVQVDKIKTDTAEQRMNLGIWSREQAGMYLGLHSEELPSEEDWQKLKQMLPSKQGWGTTPFGQSKMSNFQLLSDSSEKIGQAADKQAVALENIKEEIKDELSEEFEDRFEKLSKSY